MSETTTPEPEAAAGPPLSESLGGAPEAASAAATNGTPEHHPADVPAQAAPEAPQAPAPEPPAVAPAPDPTAALRAEIAAERAAREAIERRLAEPPPAPPPAAAAPPAPEPPTPFPNRAAFDTPDAFDTAVQQWHAAETARITRETVRTEQQRAAAEAAAQRQREAEEAGQRQQREANDRMLADWNGRRAKALETMPDFAAVAERADVTISPPMAAAIMQIESGPEVAYHLGKNPAEAARIAALPPLNAVFELGRIAAALAAPKPPAVSRTADPIRPVGAVAPAVVPALADMDMDSYAAKRQAALAASRRAPGARPH